MLSALRGVRVLDLTRILAGPFGAMILADLGAEVIKLERPDGGDETRAIGPHFIAGESVYFMSVNRAKKSVAVDLATAEGRKVLHDLAAKCDVVIENFRYGVAERLGCDAETLHAINPGLIVCGITAFGRTGPDRELPAFDLTIQARGGTMGITGEPGRLPVRMGPPMGDLAGGLYAAIAICAALYERTRTGKGRFIDLALLDCQVSLLAYAAAFQLNAGAVLGPQGSAHAHAIPYQAFATADLPITVAVFTDRFWAGFCRAIGESEWTTDARFQTAASRGLHRDGLLEAIGARFRTRGARDWLAALYAEGVPAAPVQTIDTVFADPQVLARDMITAMDHGLAGTVRVAGNPMKMPDASGEDPVSSPRVPPPPTLGQHTEEVLRDIAGYDTALITELRRAGVLGGG